LAGVRSLDYSEELFIKYYHITILLPSRKIYRLLRQTQSYLDATNRKTP
jgi:hypothetical protein